MDQSLHIRVSLFDFVVTTTSERIQTMQDTSDQETNLDTTRAGGPDDTRALETSEKEEEEEKEVNTEETDAGWR